MTDGDLVGSIVAHAAVAHGTTPIELIAGQPFGKVLDARTMAIWLTAQLRPDWDEKRIGVSFNMTPNEVVRYFGRATQKRNRTLSWRETGDRLLETVRAQDEAVPGVPAAPSEPEKAPEPEAPKTSRVPDRYRSDDPLTPRDTDEVNWGGGTFGREALKRQNDAFVKAMIEAGYQPTVQLEEVE